MLRDIFSLYYKLCCINMICIETSGVWREPYSCLQEQEKEEEDEGLAGDR